MGWTDKLSFAGGIEKFRDSSRLCYDMVPFVYLAKAISQAGAVYYYWEMDYYVTDIYTCILKADPSP